MGSDPRLSTTPRLSIVVPVYGVEAYLRDCLDSITSYPGNEIEIIAVDDASPDGCGAILDSYAQRDGRVRVIHLTANVGLSGARNAGLDRATGDYVWFVDSDDWLPDGSMQAVSERLAIHEPDVLIIDHADVYDSGRAVPHMTPDMTRGLTEPIPLTQRPRLLRLAQSACTKIARRAFLDEIDLRFRPGWYEDISFSHPLLMAAPRIDLLHRICYCYRQRTRGGITTTTSARHFEVFDQYDRVFCTVERANGAYDVFRPELFLMMINHHLVIVGNRWRLPEGTQRSYFRRAAQDYRRWLPATGYQMPPGVIGLKHRLVRNDAYSAYAALRVAHRSMTQIRRLMSSGTTVGAASASQPATLDPALADATPPRELHVTVPRHRVTPESILPNGRGAASGQENGNGHRPVEHARHDGHRDEGRALGAEAASA